MRTKELLEAARSIDGASADMLDVLIRARGTLDSIGGYSRLVEQCELAISKALIQPSASTRERRELFIKSFGNVAIYRTVETMVQRHGLAWLSDAQVSDIASEMAHAAMLRSKLNVRNSSLRNCERNNVEYYNPTKG